MRAYSSFRVQQRRWLALCAAGLLCVLAACRPLPSPAVDEALAAPSSGAESASAAASTTLFSDDFEAGTMEAWSSAKELSVQQDVVGSGRYAVRGRIERPDAVAYALKQLPERSSELYYRIRFMIVTPPEQASLYLMRARDAENASIVGVYVSNTGKLGYRNDIADQSVRSASVVKQGLWHELQLHLRLGGGTEPDGLIELWFNGARIDALSNAEQLGAAPIDRIQLGENAAEKLYDVVFDDVVVATEFIGR